MNHRPSQATRTAFDPSLLPLVLPPAPRLLVFDFDGTLSPIENRPDLARLPEKTKESLKALARTPGTTVAVLSGRDLAAVVRKVGLPEVVCFGSHGLTSTREEFSMKTRDLSRWSAETEKACALLEPLHESFPGCIVENKGPDFTVHYRLVSQDLVPRLLGEVRKLLEPFTFALLPAKRVLEVRPPGNDKGKALLKLIACVPGCLEDGLCLYAGDDVSDEDAFKAMKGLGPRALSFKVGPGETEALHRLTDTEDTARLLESLISPAGQAGSAETT